MNELENKTNAFQGVKAVYFEPSPYLATRVLAELRDRRSKSGRIAFWRRLAIASSVLTACLAVAILVPRATSYSAAVGLPFVVKLEVRELDQKQIAAIELELPGDVYFYSRQHPELTAKRLLRLPYSTGHAVPFVIQANQSGLRKIKVRFYAADDRLINERMMKIRFESRGAI